MVRRKAEPEAAFAPWEPNPSDPDDSIKEAAYHRSIVEEMYPESIGAEPVEGEETEVE